MAVEYEGYQVNGEDFDIKYRVGGKATFVRVSRAAVEDYFSLKDGAREKFAEQADDICARIGADLAARETKGLRFADRYFIKAAEFARIMKAA